MRYLLYPATDDQAVNFYQRQSEIMQGHILASSSLPPDAGRVSVYKNYKQLPNVFENDFVKKICTLVEKEGITSIVCSNDFVAWELTRMFPSMPVVTIGDGLLSLANRYLSFEKTSQIFITQFEKKHLRKPIITPLQITEILYSVSCLFGQSYASKVFHFVDILEQCPKKGIVVEVGALMGKQSTALALLGQIYEYKELLIVDPWGSNQTPQKDDHVASSDYMKLLKWDYIKKVCEAHINNQRYQNVQIIQNTIENEVKNINDISFVYLDGNHDYKAVFTQ